MNIKTLTMQYEFIKTFLKLIQGQMKIFFLILTLLSIKYFLFSDSHCTDGWVYSQLDAHHDVKKVRSNNVKFAGRF